MPAGRRLFQGLSAVGSAPGCSRLGREVLSERTMFGPRDALFALIGAACLVALPLLTMLPSPAPAQTGAREATLAAGPGREAVQANCGSCHNVNVITRSSGYSRAHWDALITTMVDLPEDQKGAVLDYLAQHYPPSHNPRPARIVDGSLQVSFREWQAQQLGQRARDPVQAPDGMIWYVGQRSDRIGRIDPQTNEVREWALPAGSLPHSVNVDAQGGVWYMGNGNGTIGRFDPVMGESREYRMPAANARDPHTAEFDRNGIMWFTLQQSNMIGRFDPATGETRLVTVPRERARPYGVKIDAEGNPWVACNGSNCIIRVDRDAMQLRVVELPGEGTTVRRLDIADDGMIWYVNSGRGRLGRYNPRTGEIREWESPSGPNSHPYAIAVIDGVVWYNEAGVRPDPLVRFDPATETFQSWPIPSGDLYAGMVRHMRATRDGNLLLHQGSTNRIILATLPPAR
jgi:virginiamycin B lyase